MAVACQLHPDFLCKGSLQGSGAAASLGDFCTLSSESFHSSSVLCSFVLGAFLIWFQKPEDSFSSLRFDNQEYIQMSVCFCASVGCHLPPWLSSSRSRKYTEPNQAILRRIGDGVIIRHPPWDADEPFGKGQFLQKKIKESLLGTVKLQPPGKPST